MVGGLDQVDCPTCRSPEQLSSDIRLSQPPVPTFSPSAKSILHAVCEETEVQREAYCLWSQGPSTVPVLTLTSPLSISLRALSSILFLQEVMINDPTVLTEQ